jgi:hypothetical protein
MIRQILFAFCGFLLIMAGYTVARLRYDPEMHLRFHRVGVLSFCDLNEIDRLHLCPQVRISQELVTEGVLVLYQCNPNEGYIETINLSDLSKAGMRAKFAVMPNKPEKVCDTKWGEVFRVTTKARIYK